MCARRFLIAVALLTLIAVAAAFAIHQFGQDILVRQATPKGAFESPPPGDPGPDYHEAANWLARPDLPPQDNPSLWLPTNLQPQTLEEPDAAVFYVHPTTYLATDRWNAPISGNTESDDRADLFVRSQASAFSGTAKIWAPRYRQAAFGAFLLKSEDADKALDLAYQDVRRAFEIFLEQNRDRPLILAGHSQGSLHLLRLLSEFGPAIRGRLVAAYVAGWPVSVAADLPSTGLPACRSAQSTGCVLSWQTFSEPANPKLVLNAWVGTRGPDGLERKREDMLCVNPVSGTLNGAAAPVANAGTLLPDGDLSEATLEPGRVGARCDEGFLIIYGDVPALGPLVLPGNNYHVYDYALFWGAIRRDAARRYSEWQN